MKIPYLRLLESAPADHRSEDFLTFIRMNNKVVFEDDAWLIIKNYKYDTGKNPWHTAFLKHDSDIWYMFMNRLSEDYANWDWLVKGDKRRTVKRFHVHLIRNPK